MLPLVGHGRIAIPSRAAERLPSWRKLSILNGLTSHTNLRFYLRNGVPRQGLACPVGTETPFPSLHSGSTVLICGPNYGQRIQYNAARGAARGNQVSPDRLPAA